MTHGAGGLLRVVAVGTACVVLCSCGSLTPKTLQGTLTGVVTTCPSVHAVTVDVLSDGALVGTATVPSGATFTFHLSPGHYEVRSGSAATRVALLAGVRAHVAIGPVCTGSGR